VGDGSAAVAEVRLRGRQERSRSSTGHSFGFFGHVHVQAYSRLLGSKYRWIAHPGRYVWLLREGWGLLFLELHVSPLGDIQNKSLFSDISSKDDDLLKSYIGDIL
jgi:hypothetical protein